MSVTVQLIPPFPDFASVNSFLVLSWLSNKDGGMKKAITVLPPRMAPDLQH